MPTFADGESGSSIRGKLNSVIAAVEQGGLGRNRIINGCMRIDQRNSGASQTFTAGAALAYSLDRWYGYSTGANVTGQRIALSNGQNRYRFTGAASVTGVGFGQRIEAANSLDMAGGSAMLQVKLSSSSLTSVGWAVYYATTTDSFGTLASPTRTLIASGTFTGVTSTEALFTASMSVPSAATTGIEVVFTGGALLATQTLTIGDVQLERGTVATTYERRQFGQEINLCMRYFYSTLGNAFQIIGVGSCSSTFADIAVALPQTSRVSPQLTRIGALSDFRIADGVTAYTPTDIVIQDGNGGFNPCINVRASAASMTGGRAGRLYTNGSTTACLQFSAEL